jgi:hypothetical protein
MENEEIKDIMRHVAHIFQQEYADKHKSFWLLKYQDSHSISRISLMDLSASAHASSQVSTVPATKSASAAHGILPEDIRNSPADLALDSPPDPPNEPSHTLDQPPTRALLGQADSIGGSAVGTFAPVRLNVGGVKYSTSKDTLLCSGYFRGLFQPWWRPDAIEVFVDRDGGLFQHILSYMRSKSLPNDEILASCREGLLEECAFFDMPGLSHELAGWPNPDDLRPNDRRVRDLEEDCRQALCMNCDLETTEHWEKLQLLNVFPKTVRPLPREDARCLGLPLLFHRDGSNASAESALSVRNLEEFKEALERITGGLLNDITERRGLVVAGGAVLAALTGGQCSDLDFFLVNVGPTQAHAHLHALLSAVKKNKHRRLANGVLADHPSSHDDVRYCNKVLVVRTRCAVTLHRAEGLRPVQLVLARFDSLLHVLVHFDVDCCCFLYDLHNDAVFGTPRSFRAVATRCNVVDAIHFGDTYEHRLEKYAARGYAIAVPGLRMSRVDPAIFDGDFWKDVRSSILWSLGPPLPPRPVPPCHVLWEKKGAGNGKRLRFTADIQRAATPVRFLRRLLVLSQADLLDGRSGRPVVHMQPEFYEHLLGATVPHYLLAPPAVPERLVIARLRSQQPLTSWVDFAASDARRVIDEVRNLLFVGAADPQTQGITPSCHHYDGLTEGSPEEHTTAPGSPVRPDAVGYIRSRYFRLVAARIREGRPIGMIFDIVDVHPQTTEETTEELSYVLDATPTMAGAGVGETVPDSEWPRRMGFTRLLAFPVYDHQHMRSRASRNWFAGVYDSAPQSYE